MKRTMKRKVFLTTAVLICAMFLTGMAANEATAFDIHFVDYTDGMQLDVSGLQVYGVHTGGPVGQILGDICLTFDPIKGLLMALGTNCIAGLQGTYYLQFDYTFINYWTAGIGDTPWSYASGRWAVGPPALEGASLGSTVPTIE